MCSGPASAWTHGGARRRWLSVKRCGCRFRQARECRPNQNQNLCKQFCQHWQHWRGTTEKCPSDNDEKRWWGDERTCLSSKSKSKSTTRVFKETACKEKLHKQQQIDRRISDETKHSNYIDLPNTNYTLFGCSSWVWVLTASSSRCDFPLGMTPVGPIFKSLI